MFEPNQTGSDMSDLSNIDNDVSELLRDSFGDPGGSELELDKNLNDILEDLKKSVSEDLKNNNGKRSFQEVSSDYNQFDNIQDLSSPDEGYGDSLLEIHKDLEFEIESDRIERLRNPRFQTMPAFKKRAKQEAQWREAVSAARRAQSLSRGQSQHQKPLTSDGFAGVPITIPLKALSQPGYQTLLPKPKPPDKESQLDLTSLDLPTSVSNSGDEDCYIVETRMKVGPLTSQKNSKTQMGAAETVKTIKTNMMISTKKHLSMSNHFPANSRIFNRSLQELQRTADVISSHYLATSREAETSSSRKPTSNFFPPYEPKPSHGFQQVNTVPDFNSMDTIQNEMIVPQDLRVFNQTNSVAVPKSVPAKKVPQSRSQPVNMGLNMGKGKKLSSPYPLSKPSQSRAKPMASSNPQPRPAASIPPLPLLAKSFPSPKPQPPLVPLSSHLPIRQPPIYNPPPPPVPVAMGPVKLPISGTSVNNNPNKCLLLNLGPQKPVILNKKQILQTVPSRRPPGFGEAPVNRSVSLPKTTTVTLPKSKASKPCHNCQKLSKYLPFLGYSWRKLLGMDKSQACGLFVRETVIYGDHMRLDHVAAAHFPTFLHNSPTVINFGESQNFIQLDP